MYHQMYHHLFLSFHRFTKIFIDKRNKCSYNIFEGDDRMKSNYVGTVEKIRMLSMYPHLLVRFSLVAYDETINCIVSKREFANKILMISEGTELAIFGHRNKRNQFVIEKMLVRKSLISA